MTDLLECREYIDATIKCAKEDHLELLKALDGLSKAVPDKAIKPVDVAAVKLYNTIDTLMKGMDTCLDEVEELRDENATLLENVEDLERQVQTKTVAIGRVHNTKSYRERLNGKDKVISEQYAELKQAQEDLEKARAEAEALKRLNAELISRLGKTKEETTLAQKRLDRTRFFIYYGEQVTRLHNRIVDQYNMTASRKVETVSEVPPEWLKRLYSAKGVTERDMEMLGRIKLKRNRLCHPENDDVLQVKYVPEKYKVALSVLNKI